MWPKLKTNKLPVLNDKDYRLPTVDDHINQQEKNMKNPFDGPNPFENVKTPEDFKKAMETMMKAMDEACSQLTDVEKELNEIMSECKSFSSTAN